MDWMGSRNGWLKRVMRADKLDYSLALSPAGRLHLLQGEDDGLTTPDSWMKRVAAAFSSSQPAGLFSLSTGKSDSPKHPSFAFWRDYSCLYMTQLCHRPSTAGEQQEPIEPPPESELAALLLSAPPMEGGEYLSVEYLRALWLDLDAWVRESIAVEENGLTCWLQKHATIWQQVGRVCFHLAENKRDPQYPFAFLATYAPSLSKGGSLQYQPLGKALEEYAGKQNKKALVNLLGPVQRASETVAFVKDLVDSGEVFHAQAWTPSEAYRLLESVPLLEESGLLVRLPNWWRNRQRPRVSVTIGEKKQNVLGVDAMLDFRVGLALGDRTLTAQEWRHIMKSKDDLVHLKGHWIEVNREKLSEALEHWKEVESAAAEGGISFVEGMRLLAGAPSDLIAPDVPSNEPSDWASIDAGKWLAATLTALRDPNALAPVDTSNAFQGTLRHYQESGRDWLWFLSSLGLGACLADDMGLGKTIQVLSLLLAIKEQPRRSHRKPSLLVLPASLLANWKAEMTRFTPTLTACFIHPSEMDKDTLAVTRRNRRKSFANIDVVVTTYAMLVRQDWLLNMEWHLVILDEAQAIKTPTSYQTRAVKKLRAHARIALTGTPVENRLSDLWSLFDFLCPGLLGSAGRFKAFVNHLEQREHDRFTPLRTLVQPYILRRLKSDKHIITDLPDKTEMKAFCGLSKRQAALYARSVRELAKNLDGVEGIDRRGLVLTYLMRFKQICNHPSHFLGDGLYDPSKSGKFDRLMALCTEIASRQEKVLVFTQFRQMTQPIATFLGDVFGHEGLVLHGGTAVKKRKRLIEAFQQEDGPPFFVLSLKAGGLGLNLTAASHVIHFDRWWNPAVENQATDRAFRIGQKKNVLVHKFVCRGTVEEKIDAMIEEKLQLVDDVLEAGAESKLTEMDDEELMAVVALDIDRAGL